MKSGVNASGLAILSDGNFVDGELAYVSTFRDYFALNRSSVATPDGKTIIATLSGLGRWERLNIPHPSWMRQSSWYVDSAHVNANDENVGDDPSAPLATDAERQRRWGLGMTAIVPPNVGITVNYPSSPSDKFNLDVMYMDGGSVRIVGTATVTKSGTLSAVTTISRPSPWDVTGGSLGAADEGFIIRIPSGARAGNYAGIAKDLTGNNVRTGPFGNLSISSAVSTGPAYTGATPVSSDPFDVISLPILTVGSICVRSATNSIPTSTPTNCVVFDSVHLYGPGSGAFTANGTLYSIGACVFTRSCIIDTMWIRGSGAFYAAGGIWRGNNFVLGDFSVFGGPYCQALGFVQYTGSMNIHTGTSIQLGGDCLFQDASLNVRGQVYGEYVGIFDRTISNLALTVHETGHYMSFPITSSDLLYGNNNAGVGCKVIAGGKLTYNTKPSMNTSTGTGRQSLIGGTNKDWSAVPYVETTNNAMIVARA